jgi:formamidopyrimidine-DNA glycosylase
MPELPEVETLRRGLEPLVVGRRIEALSCRVPKLRQPLDPAWHARVSGQQIRALTRRAKYLLFTLERGTLLLHLGMTGVLRLLTSRVELQKHDHVTLHFDNGQVLRFNDSRRFGLLLYLETEPFSHALLKNLGPEPLDFQLSCDYLFSATRRRRIAIKNLIMDQHCLVGVGNIYASEALFAAGIDPRRPAFSLTEVEACRLLKQIRKVLQQALEAGGTTLRDFRHSDGKPGYFRRQLQVYGRGGEKCLRCGQDILQLVLGQRSTFFCPQCQN